MTSVCVDSDKRSMHLRAWFENAGCWRPGAVGCHLAGDRERARCWMLKTSAEWRLRWTVEYSLHCGMSDAIRVRVSTLRRAAGDLHPARTSF